MNWELLQSKAQQEILAILYRTQKILWELQSISFPEQTCKIGQTAREFILSYLANDLLVFTTDLQQA